jgi:membrane-bound serine protease (ClpP class)
MKEFVRNVRQFLLPVICFLIFCSVLLPECAAAKKLRFDPDAKNEVYFIPQFTEFKEISMQDLYFLKKILNKAAKEKVKAVIFELDTPGGRIDVALKYVSILSRSKVPVIAYLNPQGISAGMIIAMAANRIAINPDGVIGDAMPIQMSPGGIKPITDDSSREDEKKTIEKGKKEEKKEAEKAKKKDSKSDKKEKEKPAKEKKKEEKPKGENTKTLERIIKELQELKGKRRNPSKHEQNLANQKFLTVFFKVLQVLAEKNDRPVRVIRAMADPYQKLSVKEDGIQHTKVSPLTLSAREAKKLHVVDYICGSRSELLTQLGLGDCELKVIEKSTTDQLVSFLSHPFIAFVLLILGIVGIYIEVRTPGFGVPGILGLTALTLFFLGHVGSGASEWGPIVIFFVGLVLLLLELFVIPGFGIVGILGISCIVISFFAAFGIENIQTASYVIGSAFTVSTALIIVLTIYVLPKSTLFRRLRLDTEQKSQHGYSSHKEADESLLHKHGIAHTTLRPVGIAIIDGRRYEVATEGDYIENGCEIEVIEVTNLKILVKRV